jgi:hypothetical protein
MAPRLLRVATLLAMAAVTSAATITPKGIGTVTLFNASGARSGAGLTTMVACSNVGAISGSIGITAASFNTPGFDCSSYVSGVLPGQTVTFAIDAVASMANVQLCSPTGTVLNQGRISVFSNVNGTLKWTCTAQLVDKIGNPPTALARLSLYTAGGALLSDVIFADGFEP